MLVLLSLVVGGWDWRGKFEKLPVGCTGGVFLTHHVFSHVT